MSFYTCSDIKIYNFKFLNTMYSLEVNDDFIGTFYIDSFYDKGAREHVKQIEFEDQKELDLFLKSLETAGNILDIKRNN